MAGKIQGITIEIGGNTTKLQKALKNTNKEIKETQGELKQVERLLKLDPKNTELVAQKQKLLAKAIGDTKEKLDTVREAEKQVRDQFARGEVGEEQYRAIQREVVRTEQDLKKLEGRLKGVNESWEKAAKDIGNFGDKATNAGKSMTTNVTAPIAAAGIAATVMGSQFDDAIAKVSTIADVNEIPLDTLRQQILDLSDDTGIAAEKIADDVYNAISAGQKTGDAVAFVAQSSKLAKAGFAESAQSLDLLTTIMNAYGLEADEVNKVSDMLIQTQNKGKVTVGELSSAMGKIIPTAKANGVELDQVSAGYAILTSNGIAAAEATTYMNGMFNELGKTGSKTDEALRELSGKSFKQLMDEGASVTDVLAMLNENAEKNGLSLADMFGSAEAAKAALTLLGDDASTFNETVKQMNDSTGATEEAFEKLQTAGEKTRISFNEIKNAAMELGAVMLPIIEELAEKISELADRFKALSPETKELILIIAGIVAAIGPVLLIIGKFATAISGIMTIVTPLVTALGSSGLIGALASVGGVIAVVVAAIAGLVIMFKTMWETNEEFRDRVMAIWEQIKYIFTSVIEYIKMNVQKSIEEFQVFWSKHGEKIIEIVSAMWENIQNLINAAMEIIQGILNVFIGLFTGDWNTFSKGISQIWEGLWRGIQSIIDFAFKFIKDGIGVFISEITGNWGAFGEAIRASWELQWDLIKAIVDSVIIITKGIIQGFIQLITGDWDGFKQTMIDTWQGLWDAVNGVVSRAWDLLSGSFSILLKSISTWFTDLKESAIQWGKDVINGFADGIKEKISSAVSAASDLANGVSSSIRNFFEIASPSKLMKRFGKFIAEGLAKGIEGGSTIVKEQADLIAQVVGNALTSVQETVNQTVAVIQKEFELWKLSNQGLAGSSEELKQKLQMQEEQQKALTEELKVTELALEKIGNTYGYASEEAMKYREKLLDIKIEQQELTNSIADTSKEIENMRTQMSKVNYSYTGKSGESSSKGSLAYSLYVGNAGGTSGKYSASQEAYEAGRDILAREIAMREGVDMSVGKSMADQQMRENAKAIEQNITINSPKALNPSETAKEFKKASQKMALEY